MLILLSPSKTLDETSSGYLDFTIPVLLDSTKELLEEFKELSTQQLEEKMHISPKIAQLTYRRFRDFSLPFTLKNANQAIFAFRGGVYKFVTPTTYSKEDFDFAQKHLRILSGFYGVLRPLDLMQPYRLEMGLVTRFWKEKISAFLTGGKDEVIVNLASQEYFSAVDLKNKRIISPVFKELKNGEYKMITIYTKYARGLMANWMIEHKITDPDELKNFSLEGYSYSSEFSSVAVPVFVRGSFLRNLFSS